MIPQPNISWVAKQQQADLTAKLKRNRQGPSVLQLQAEQVRLLKRQDRLTLELTETTNKLSQINIAVTSITEDADSTERLTVPGQLRRALRTAGLWTITDLTHHSRTTLLKLRPGLRTKSIMVVEQALSEIGLTLHKDMEAWTPLASLSKSDYPLRLRLFAQEHGLLTIGALVGFCYGRRRGFELTLNDRDASNLVESLCFRAGIANPGDYRPRPKVPMDQTIASIHEIIHVDEVGALQETVNDWHLPAHCEKGR